MSPTRAPGGLSLSRWGLGLLALAVVALARPGAAEPVRASAELTRKEALPERLEGITVDERLDARVPLDLAFTDEQGQPILLRELFDGTHPVVITLNYSGCPMLCSLQLDGFARSLAQVDWSAGQEFRVVTISLDPTETPATAAQTQRKYLSKYGREGADRGWRFLTGSERNVRALADAIGFRYAYNEARDEWVHPAAITLVTPDGRVGRYLYGIEYHPRTLRLSLAEVSEGKVGSTVDRLILYCFHYDEREGRYAPMARNLMRLGGGLAVLVLGAMLGAFWWGELQRKKRAHA